MMSQVFVSVLQIAFSVGYVIVILRMASSVLPAVPKWAVVATLLVGVLLMAFIRHLRDLWWVSFLGIFVAVVGVIGVTTVTGILHFEASDAKIPFWGEGFLCSVTPNAGDLVSHMGSFLYSVEAINHVMPNANAMTHPSDLPLVISVVMGTYAVLVGGFFLFAAQVGFGKCPAGGSILLDCLPSGPVTTAVKSAVCVQMLASFPVTMFPAMEMLEQRLFSQAPVTADLSRLNDDTLSDELLEQHRSKTEPQHDDHSTVSPPEDGDGSSALCPVHRMFRVVVFVAVVFCALAVPDFETFTGLVGSLLLSTLGFLLPIALLETLRRRNREPAGVFQVLHGFIVALGVVVAVVGTENSVAKAARG